MAQALPWDRATVIGAIKEVADTATDLTFIMSNQPGPRTASLPYGTFLLNGGPLLDQAPSSGFASYDSGAAAGEEITLHYGGQATLLVSYQAFSEEAGTTDSAVTHLERLSAYLHTGAARSTLETAGIGLAAIPQPSDISEVVGAVMQSRATMDVLYNVCIDPTETTGYIDIVEYEGEITTDAGDTVTTSDTVTGP